MNKAKTLAKESEDLINAAKTSSNNTIDQAVKLIAEGKAPLPDFDHEQRNGESGGSFSSLGGKVGIFWWSKDAKMTTLSTSHLMLFSKNDTILF